MAKARISIGVDDATGQPENAPAGPYITDDDDGSRPRRKTPPRFRSGSGDKGTAREKDLTPPRKGPAQP
jgi:hypothetical protein